MRLWALIRTEKYRLGNLGENYTSLKTIFGMFSCTWTLENINAKIHPFPERKEVIFTLISSEKHKIWHGVINEAPLQTWLCRKWWNTPGWTLLERKHLNFRLTEILCAINLEVKAVSSLGLCTLQSEIMAKKALCLDTNWMRHPATPRMTTIGHMVAYQISSTHWKDLRSVWEWRCTPGRKSKQFIGKATFFQLIRIILQCRQESLLLPSHALHWRRYLGTWLQILKEMSSLKQFLQSLALKLWRFTAIRGGKTLLLFTTRHWNHLKGSFQQLLV